MIVHRFMSEAEYQSLLKGKVLCNSTNHRKKGQKSSSIGFCFFVEDPEEAVHWLSGIVDLNWCVTLEVDDGFLIQSCGWYADESKMSLQRRLMLGQQVPMMKKVEYCRCRYSLDDVKFLGATDKYYHIYPTKEEQKRLMAEFLKKGYI